VFDTVVRKKEKMDQLNTFWLWATPFKYSCILVDTFAMTEPDPFSTANALSCPAFSKAVRPQASAVSTTSQ
jgi:hypothetical protein